MKNHLLLIGIDNYPKFNPPGDRLTTCIKDVTDFKYVLLEKYFFEQEQVIELLNQNATNLSIQKVFEDYSSQIEPISNLIIYYSGHGGLRKSNNKGYWIPYDSSESDYTTWIANETILELVKKIKAKHIFIISDCCFASSLLITNPAKSHKNISLDQYKSRWILTSGREETYCGSLGENSYFAEMIITFLGNADENIRVGSLIEYVKEKFKSNILQQPQGYPLMDNNHDAGEFVFKIKDKKKLFEREIKGYNLFKKVIDIYSKSNSVIELERFEDKSNRIGYTLLLENDNVRKEVTYYLYLYNEINISRTYSHINEKHKGIFKNTIVFLPKEEGQIFLDRRLNNVQKLFSPKNLFYIDDFISNLSRNLFSNEESEKYLNISNFIVPEFLVDNSKPIIEIEKWLNINDNPILVIKGTAGIGKTTFAKYISDSYQNNNKSNSKGNVLFIDSNEIQEELLYQQKLGKKVDLYSFYKAATSNDTALDKELFSINLDAGNLLLIIDGLDEIISRNISFDIDYFFKSINSSNIGLGNTKIVITTRSYFWDKSNITDDIIYNIELMPFDLVRAKKFFEKSFRADDSKVKKALQIAEDFKLPSNDKGMYYYHPFVLDIIKEIIESKNEILFSDNLFNSEILNHEIKVDYIIGRICEREIKRVQQIEVDKQIKLFIHLAVRENGKFSEFNMKEYITESLEIKGISKNIAEAFNSHPFLHYDIINKNLNFKYDFFENYFISLYVSKLIDLNSNLDFDLNAIKLLSQKLYHGSDTIKNILRRITSWNEDNLLKMGGIISDILTFDVEAHIKKKAIAGIFNLALAINFKIKGNNKSLNRQLILDLFGSSKNSITNLVLLNISSLEESIRFDFTGLNFEDCVFENYNQFWDCSMNNETYFHKCILRNIGTSSKEIKIPIENFIDCDQDNSIFNTFQNKENKEILKINKVKIFIEDFFKIFYKNGQFKKISEFLLDEPANYPRINKFGVKRNNITDILLNNDILVRIEDKKRNDIKICINPLYVEDITKFCFEGKNTPKLINIVNEISETI